MSLFSFFSFYWSVVGLQCCINSCCIAKWLNYTYINIYIVYFYIIFHYGISQYTDIVPRAVCRTSLFTHSIYKSLHLLFPTSHSFPPPLFYFLMHLGMWLIQDFMYNVQQCGFRSTTLGSGWFESWCPH